MSLFQSPPHSPTSSLSNSSGNLPNLDGSRGLTSSSSGFRMDASQKSPSSKSNRIPINKPKSPKAANHPNEPWKMKTEEQIRRFGCYFTSANVKQCPRKGRNPIEKPEKKKPEIIDLTNDEDTEIEEDFDEKIFKHVELVKLTPEEVDEAIQVPGPSDEQQKEVREMEEANRIRETEKQEEMIEKVKCHSIPEKDFQPEISKMYEDEDQDDEEPYNVSMSLFSLEMLSVSLLEIRRTLDSGPPEVIEKFRQDIHQIYKKIDDLKNNVNQEFKKIN